MSLKIQQLVNYRQKAIEQMEKGMLDKYQVSFIERIQRLSYKGLKDMSEQQKKFLQRIIEN